MPTRPKAVLIASGGAPNSPLMAGALAAIYAKGMTFDTIFASGAGALVGMVFLAPKNKSVPDALRGLLSAGVNDLIYGAFPLGYKTFHKTGPFAKPMLQAAIAFHLSNPLIPPAVRSYYNDMVDFWFAAATPTDLNLLSLGLCRPFPFVDDLVDFDLLSGPTMRDRFYMNSYCIEDARIVNFDNDEITKDFFHAALAFPFIYCPALINGKHYFEGSSVDPINFTELASKINDGTFPPDTTFVLMDVLGAFEQALVRLPRNLVDSFGISIITPVCSLAKMSRTIFELQMPKIKLNVIPFDVPDDKKPFMLDWSVSNMQAMWDVGYTAGAQFVRIYSDLLRPVM